jgi:hypothetical protein
MSHGADGSPGVRRSLAIFAGFAIFYLLLRLPMLMSQWDGEDVSGALGALVLGFARAPEDMLIARIDGVMQFSPGYVHPAPPYVLLSILAKAVRAVVPLASLHGQSLVAAIKAVNSLVQLAAMLVLLSAVTVYARSRTAIAWIWVLAAAPVAIYGSNEIQSDSGTGFFLISLFFVGLFVAQFQDRKPLRMICLFAAGFFGGLGKNEWTLCLAAALAFTAVAHPLVRYLLRRLRGIELNRQDDDVFIVVALPALGLLLANGVSYWADPANYMGGWYLMRDVVRKGSLVSGDFQTWATLLRAKSTYVFFHVVVLTSGMVMLVHEPRCYSAPVLLAFASGAALFLSFFGSWASAPRYFAPAYIGLGVAFLMIMVRAPPSTLKRGVVAATMLAVSLQSAFFLTQWIAKGRGKVDVAAMLAKRELETPNCVLVIDSAYVLDRPDIDFVHISLGGDAIGRYLEKFGRVACPQ